MLRSKLKPENETSLNTNFDGDVLVQKAELLDIDLSQPPHVHTEANSIFAQKVCPHPWVLIAWLNNTEELRSRIKVEFSNNALIAALMLAFLFAWAAESPISERNSWRQYFFTSLCFSSASLFALCLSGSVLILFQLNHMHSTEDHCWFVKYFLTGSGLNFSDLISGFISVPTVLAALAACVAARSYVETWYAMCLTCISICPFLAFLRAVVRTDNKKWERVNSNHGSRHCLPSS